MVSDAWAHLYGNSPQLPMIGQPVGMFLFPQCTDWSVGGLSSLTVCSVPGYCQSRQHGTRAGPRPAAARTQLARHPDVTTSYLVNRPERRISGLCCGATLHRLGGEARTDSGGERSRRGCGHRGEKWRTEQRLITGDLASQLIAPSV